MKLLSFFCLIPSFFASPTWAEDISSVSIPLSYPLSSFTDFAKSQIPETLTRKTSVRRCVEPQKACNKIPELRGSKIYSRMECVQVTPGIDCSIDQTVVPKGTLMIQGQDNMLILQQDFHGTVTVRGHGEIGSHIRETAMGTVRMTIRARPSVNSDLTVSMPVFEPHIQWLQTPRAISA